MRSPGEVIMDLVLTGLSEVQKGLVLELAALATTRAVEPTKAAKAARNARYYQAQKARKASDKATESGLNKTTETTESGLIQPVLARVEDKPSTTVPEDTSEPNGSPVISRPSEKPPPNRGSRLPRTWEPSETDVAFAVAEGMTPQEISRAADEFRDYWTARSGREAAKLDWSATWRNRVRDVAGGRRRNGARLATGPAEPGGGRRGAVSFADHFARRHGRNAD